MAGTVVSGLTRAFTRFQQNRNRNRTKTHVMDKYTAEEGEGEEGEGEGGQPVDGGEKGMGLHDNNKEEESPLYFVKK